MKYHNVSNWDLFLLALMIGVVSAVLSCGFYLYMDYRMLPIVHKDKGKCIKVENLENGQAFNCDDVDVILRRYRSPQNLTSFWKWSQD